MPADPTLSDPPGGSEGLWTLPGLPRAVDGPAGRRTSPLGKLLRSFPQGPWKTLRVSHSDTQALLRLYTTKRD